MNRGMLWPSVAAATIYGPEEMHLLGLSIATLRPAEQCYGRQSRPNEDQPDDPTEIPPLASGPLLAAAHSIPSEMRILQG